MTMPGKGNPLGGIGSAVEGLAESALPADAQDDKPKPVKPSDLPAPAGFEFGMWRLTDIRGVAYEWRGSPVAAVGLLHTETGHRVASAHVVSFEPLYEITEHPDEP